MRDLLTFLRSTELGAVDVCVCVSSVQGREVVLSSEGKAEGLPNRAVLNGRTIPPMLHVNALLYDR